MSREFCTDMDCEDMSVAKLMLVQDANGRAFSVGRPQCNSALRQEIAFLRHSTEDPGRRWRHSLWL